jgi:thiol-disulfide isomerase/thioredoxin
MKKFVLLILICTVILTAFARVPIKSDTLYQGKYANTHDDGTAIAAEKRVSIVELFTATWCHFCPAAEKGVSAAYAQHKDDFIFLEYHIGRDGLSTKETENRAHFYYVTGTPTGVVNGTYKFISSDAIVQKGVDRALFDAKEMADALVRIESVSLTKTGIDAYVSTDSAISEDTNLFILLVEDHVQYKGKDYRFVVRSIKEFDAFKSGEKKAEFKLDSSYSTANLYIVAFVQGAKSRKIYQSAMQNINSNASALLPPSVLPASDTFKSMPVSVKLSGGKGATEFEVQITTDPEFQFVIKDRKTFHTLVEFRDLISADYYIRARGLNGGKVSSWSKLAQFTVDIEKVLKMKIGSPYMFVDNIMEEIDPNRDTKPIIIAKWGRTVVPIRAIVEALGGTIQWDGKTRSITITLVEKQLPPAPPTHTIYIVMKINDPIAYVNGEKRWIDSKNHSVKPVIINDRTMVPLRFVAENLGCTVQWDGNTRTITIKKKE